MGNSLIKMKEEAEKIDKLILLEFIVDEILIYEELKNPNSGIEKDFISLLKSVKDYLLKKKDLKV
jgi:hypothetical protein